MQKSRIMALLMKAQPVWVFSVRSLTWWCALNIRRQPRTCSPCLSTWTSSELVFSKFQALTVLRFKMLKSRVWSKRPVVLSKRSNAAPPTSVTKFYGSSTCSSTAASSRKVPCLRAAGSFMWWISSASVWMSSSWHISWNLIRTNSSVF